MKHADYGHLLTQAYDLDKPTAPPKELAYYRSFIERGGQPVLALMCGSGRFLLPLLEAGIDIDGVDASPDMLAACRRKLTERGLPDRTHEQYLQELDLPRSYACAYVGGGGSFGLIRNLDDASEALRRIHAHLEPGGLLQLEVQTPNVAKDIRHGRVRIRAWSRADGARIVLTETSLSYEDSVLESIGKYELFADNKLVETELDDFPQRLYEPPEIASLVERAGFEDVTITKGYGNDALDGTEWLLSVRGTR